MDTRSSSAAVPSSGGGVATDTINKEQSVCRALVLSNGALGAEGQCLGLVRALGLSGGKKKKKQTCDVHLVGEAALALAPRLGAAWGERLSMSAGAVGLVKRGDPRPSPLPWYLAYVARFIRALPASWHVALHSAWDGIFGWGGYLDVVWLGADLRPMVAAAMEAYHGAGIGRTLVVASGRGTVPACSAMKRRCGEAVFCVQVQHPRCDPRLFDLVVCPQHDFASPKAAAVAAAEGGSHVCVTRAALHRLDADALAAARENWRRDFMLRPGPRLVVCIGGPTRHCRLGGWSNSIIHSGESGGRWWWWWAGLRAWRLLTDITGRRAAAAAEEEFAEEVADFVTTECILSARCRASGGSFRNRRYPSACSDPAAAYNRVRAGGGGGGAFRFGSVFVTFSRRTPKSLRAALHRHFALRMVAAHTNAKAEAAAAAAAAASASASSERRGVPSGGRHRHRHNLDRDDDIYEEASESELPVVAAASSSGDVTAPLVAATTDDSDGLASMLFGPKIHTAWARERSVSPIVLPKSPGLWVWDDQGPNPYEGAMAWADAVLVTADSVSMLSEAASLGVPVIVAGWRFATGKAALLLSALATAGAVRAMEDVSPDDSWKGKILQRAGSGGSSTNVRGGERTLDGSLQQRQQRQQQQQQHQQRQQQQSGIDDVSVAAERVLSMVRVRLPGQPISTSTSSSAAAAAAAIEKAAECQARSPAPKGRTPSRSEDEASASLNGAAVEVEVEAEAAEEHAFAA